MEETRTVYKTAIYLRLSKDDGDNKESQSISNQRKSIFEFINKSNQDKFIIIDEYRRWSVIVELILTDQIFKDF